LNNHSKLKKEIANFSGEKSRVVKKCEFSRKYSSAGAPAGGDMPQPANPGEGGKAGRRIVKDWFKF
jgi:hypothetical protein